MCRVKRAESDLLVSPLNVVAFAIKLLYKTSNTMQQINFKTNLILCWNGERVFLNDALKSKDEINLVSIIFYKSLLN